MSIENEPGDGPLLEKAIHDLEHAQEDRRATDALEVKATCEEEEALREIEEAKRVEEEKRQFKVDVLYNGQPKKFEVRRHEKVDILRTQAINAFGPITNPHLLGLFKDGKELKDSDTIREAGVEPHDELLLRPSEVRGGA